MEIKDQIQFSDLLEQYSKKLPGKVQEIENIWIDIQKNIT
jgi:hypothetical protein